MLRAFLVDLGAFVRRHWRIIAIPPIAVLSLLVAANATFYLVSSRPSSCRTCHYMDPYYRQWESSSHKEVSCIECHKFRPAFITVTTAKYLTGLYAPRPRANIADASCLKSGCHSGLLDNGQVKFRGAIRFDHKDHLEKLRRGVKLKCTSCHSQIVQGRHISVTEKVCFLCHFRGTATAQAASNCIPCHGYPTKPVRHEGFLFKHDSYLKLKVACDQCHAEVTEGRGGVPEERCWDCHVERTWAGKTPYFIHTVHVTRNGVDCFRCHESISHSGFRMARTLDVECKSCHTRRHSPEKELYMGIGGVGVRDTPSRMFAAQVACDGCHGTRMTEGQGQEEKEDLIATAKQSCVVCHGEGYDAMLDDWRRELGRALRVTGEIVNLAAEAKKRGRIRTDLQHLVNDAVANLNLVRRGKGVHNVDYSLKLLNAAWDQAELALKAARSSDLKPARPRILSEPDLYCTALCHERIGLPEEVRFQEMEIDFPHLLHATGLGLSCTICHSPEKHQMRIISKEGCMNCHHGGVEELGCEQCHGAQASLYQGEIKVAGVTATADPMAEVGIPCTACHDLSAASQSLASIKDACVGCHEPGYDRMLIEWERTLLDEENKLTVRLDDVRRLLDRQKRIGKDNPEAVKMFETANMVYETITGAKGVHNYELSVRLFAHAMELLEGADQLLTVKPQDGQPVAGTN